MRSTATCARRGGLLRRSGPQSGRASAKRNAGQTCCVASAQRQLLHPEIPDFTDVEDILGAAIDRIDGAELLEQLAGPAKLADDRSVQAHLVDLAGRIEVIRRIRVRHV